MKLAAGQVAVVSGATRGIGPALCEVFTRRNLSLVVADTDSDALDETAKQFVAAGVPTLKAVVDVTCAKEVERLAEQTMAEFGRVDIVCNNGGIANHEAALWEYDIKDWQQLLEVNLWGVIHGMKAFVPKLVQQGTGHVLNTASVAGLYPVLSNGPHNATQYAVVSLSETLAADFAEYAPGVGATVVCPDLPGPPPGIESARIAEAAVAGIEEEKVYVAPDSTAKDRAAARVDGLLAALRAELTADVEFARQHEHRPD